MLGKRPTGAKCIKLKNPLKLQNPLRMRTDFFQFIKKKIELLIENLERKMCARGFERVVVEVLV